MDNLEANVAKLEAKTDQLWMHADANLDDIVRIALHGQDGSEKDAKIARSACALVATEVARRRALRP